MMKAIWNGQIVAESDDIVMVDGNHYFPQSSLCMKFFQDSKHTSTCFWKGQASYYSIVVDGEINQDCAWYYSSPKKRAQNIVNRVAFWRGVEVVN